MVLGFARPTSCAAGSWPLPHRPTASAGRPRGGLRSRTRCSRRRHGWPPGAPAGPASRLYRATSPGPHLLAVRRSRPRPEASGTARQGTLRETAPCSAARVAQPGDLAASPIHPLKVTGTEQEEAGQLLVDGSTAVGAPSADLCQRRRVLRLTLAGLASLSTSGSTPNELPMRRAAWAMGDVVDGRSRIG